MSSDWKKTFPQCLWLWGYMQIKWWLLAARGGKTRIPSAMGEERPFSLAAWAGVQSLQNQLNPSEALPGGTCSQPRSSTQWLFFGRINPYFQSHQNLLRPRLMLCGGALGGIVCEELGVYLFVTFLELPAAIWIMAKNCKETFSEYRKVRNLIIPFLNPPSTTGRGKIVENW